MVAASAEQRRQRGSEAATAGSAVTASAAQDGGGRNKDNGGDSDGGVHSRQSTKRGSGRDDIGGDDDGGGNSNSDGNGDGDSEDKDGDADVKGFFGWHSTEDCFQRGSYNFLVSVQYVVFGGGRTTFLVWSFANKRESRTYDSVYDLRRENTTKNTLNMFCGENVSVPLYLCMLSSVEI